MLSKFPKKIRIVKKFFDNSNFNFEGKEILDIGGTNDYCEILRSIFKPGKVYLLNYDKSQLQGVENSFVQDATNLQFEDKSWDIITSFDVIEHLNNPDDLLSESYRVLKDEGLFIISSPNLADCFSRITFLFGYIPFFYTPCQHRVGTPFNKKGPIMYHKSVFTCKAFEELLKIHNFSIIQSFGFSYTDEFYLDLDPSKKNRQTAYKFRKKLDKIMPKDLSEGFLYICKKIN